MASPRKFPLHIRILQNELNDRKARNARYSMRALARALDMDAASLSRILAGKQDVSLQACRVILQKLNLPPLMARLFIASVAEDKRNRSHAILTRALDPKFLNEGDSDPRFEDIVDPKDQFPLGERDVFALTEDLVSIMDIEGRFLHANETIAKALQTIPCDLIGEHWPETTFDINTPALLEKQQAEMVRAKRELTFEFTTGRHGREKTFRRTITPVWGTDGEMTAYVSTIRDITWDHFLKQSLARLHSSLKTPEILSIAAHAPTPLLAESSIVRMLKPTETIAARHYGDESKGYDAFASAFARSIQPGAQTRIETLSATSSGQLAYQDHVPANIIIAPFEVDESTSGVQLFLRKRPYGPLDLKVAAEFTQTLSLSLRNAQLFAKHA